jgi:hypothetical protein
MANQKGPLLRALRTCADELRKEFEMKETSARKEFEMKETAVRIQEVLEGYLQCEGVDGIARDIAQSPQHVQATLMGAMLRCSHLPTDKISMLIDTALGTKQEGRSAVPPSVSSMTFLKTEPPTARVTTSPGSPQRPLVEATASAPESNWSSTHAKVALSPVQCSWLVQSAGKTFTQQGIGDLAGASCAVTRAIGR